jgi:ketosteroid isomerase-like protein
MMRTWFVIAAAALVLGPPAAAAASPDAAAVVDAFHAALKKGDTEAASDLIADNALIFEEGGAERSKAEYAGHHLAADAEFSKGVVSATVRRFGDTAGDVAWVATEGRTTGKYKGKPVDQLTTETMIVRKFEGGWKIVHIHWSSAAAPID